jgi:hypothetical protein
LDIVERGDIKVKTLFLWIEIYTNPTYGALAEIFASSDFINNPNILRIIKLFLDKDIATKLRKITPYTSFIWNWRKGSRDIIPSIPFFYSIANKNVGIETIVQSFKDLNLIYYGTELKDWRGKVCNNPKIERLFKGRQYEQRYKKLCDAITQQPYPKKGYVLRRDETSLDGSCVFYALGYLIHGIKDIQDQMRQETIQAYRENVREGEAGISAAHINQRIAAIRNHDCANNFDCMALGLKHEIKINRFLLKHRGILDGHMHYSSDPLESEKYDTGDFDQCCYLLSTGGHALILVAEMGNTTIHKFARDDPEMNELVEEWIPRNLISR